MAIHRPCLDALVSLQTERCGSKIVLDASSVKENLRNHTMLFVPVLTLDTLCPNLNQYQKTIPSHSEEYQLQRHCVLYPVFFEQSLIS